MKKSLLARNNDLANTQRQLEILSNGIFTDGDLRRILEMTVDIHTTKIADHMTKNYKTGHAGMLAVDAVKLMQLHKINALLIDNNKKQLIGALNMHDLLRAGIV